MTLKLVPDPSPWRRSAACLGADPATFYPERGDTAAVRTALAICATCPVTTDCLDDAIVTFEYDGIRGGLTPRQRRRVRTARLHAARTAS